MDPVTLLVVAVVCLAIGYVAGTLITSSRSDQEKADRKAAAGHLEVARIFRDNPEDPLMLMMDSKLIGSPTVLSGDQHTRLEKLILDLTSWLGFSPAIASGMAGQNASQPESTAQPAFVGLNGPLAAVPAVILPPAVPPFAAAPKSIVGQIDDILQEHLVGSPFADKLIRLVEKDELGVVVMVGTEQYPGIDAVPDQEVRNLIRDAVSEWEQKAK